MSRPFSARLLAFGALATFLGNLSGKELEE
jgi:hypothetical protein